MALALDDLFTIESKVSFYSKDAGVGIKILTSVKNKEGNILCPQDTKDFGVWHIDNEAMLILAEQLVKERQEEVAQAFLKVKEQYLV